MSWASSRLAAGWAAAPAAQEPVQIYFHALRHPTRGLFLVDTGTERALRDRPERLVAEHPGVDVRLGHQR